MLFNSLLIRFRLLAILLAWFRLALFQVLAEELFPVPGTIRNGPIRVKWSTDWEPVSKVSCIKVDRLDLNRSDLSRLSAFFAMQGTTEQIPGNVELSPGLWVRDRFDKSRLKWRSAYISFRDNLLGYSSGDDGFRWDIANHLPLVTNVPSLTESIVLCENVLKNLFPAVTLAKKFNNSIMASEVVHGVRYFPRGTTNVSDVTQERGVRVFQKVGDGILMGPGDLGSAVVKFISNREVSSIECQFVQEVWSSEIRSASKIEIASRVFEGQSWGLNVEKGSNEIYVDGVDVVYPISRNWRRGPLMPFYRLRVKNLQSNNSGFVFVEAISSTP